MSDDLDERALSGDLSDEEKQAFYEKLQNEPIYFNGINGATGEYGLPPMSGDDLASIIKGERPPENISELKAKSSQKGAGVSAPIKPPNDPARLDEAGWAIVFPALSPIVPAVKEALADLLKLRQPQAGPRFKIFEGPEGYRPNETKAQFCARHKIGDGPADPEQMPYYVLLVGSPEEIPYRFQYQLDVMRGVGRIHFDTLQEYANYAESVVMSESGRVKLPRQACFFGVANPDDKATEQSVKYLVAPLYERLKKLQPFSRWMGDGDQRTEVKLDWTLETFVREQASKAQLGSLLAGPQRPSLLFTASHGMEFPLGDARQIRHQGALLCQDWPGPNAYRGKIPESFYFSGDDLTQDANLLGSVIVHFACFGAGTPHLDEFARQAGKKEREILAARNFIANLPQRLLSRPRGGALAVIGHVERAWGYSFLLPGAGAQIGVFESMFRELMMGDRVGWATEHFNLRYADLATNLSDVLGELEYDPSYINPYDLAGMWTANNDARGYVLLGDPAARIPFALPNETTAERPSITLSVETRARLEKLGATLGTTQTATSGERTAPKQEAFSPTITEPASVQPEDVETLGVREQIGDLKDSIQKFANELAAALSKTAKEIATLEVKTFTTEDMDAVSQAGAGNALNVKLRALTRIAFNGNTEVYVPERAGGQVDRDLWQLHLDMVRQAQANRAQFLQAVAEMAANLLKIL